MHVCQNCNRHYCKDCTLIHRKITLHSVASSKSYPETCDKHGHPTQRYDIRTCQVKCRDCIGSDSDVHLSTLKLEIFIRGPSIYDKLVSLEQVSGHTADCYTKWLNNPYFITKLEASYEPTARKVAHLLSKATIAHQEIRESLKGYDCLLIFGLYTRYKDEEFFYDPQVDSSQLEQLAMGTEPSLMYYLSRGGKFFFEFSFETQLSARKQCNGAGLVPFNRWCSFVTLANGHLFVTGGKVSKDDGALRQAIFLNPTTCEILNAEPMLLAHSSHILIKVGTYVYAISGKNAQNFIHCSSERYNLEDGTWEAIADITNGRTCAANCNIDDLIYVFGGYESRVENRIEQYSISNNTWTILNALLPEKMWQASAFPINSHQILIYGGESNVDDLQRNSYIYDTTDSTFDYFTSIPTPASSLFFWNHSIRRKDCLFLMSKSAVLLEYSIRQNRWTCVRSS